MALPFKYGMVALHPLQAPDRLGNPDIEFPIGIVFGDNDFFGSEGADDLVRMNKHYESGRSQLFKIPNCTHNMTKDKPKEFYEIMNGFFDGTITGRFEEKPAYELAFEQK